MNSGSRHQRGYALPEVLVATAIAAGVLTAVSASLSSIVHLHAATLARAETLNELNLISARLDAGMEERDVLEGLRQWRLNYAPFDPDALADHQLPFERVTVTLLDHDDIHMEMLAPARREYR